VYDRGAQTSSRGEGRENAGKKTKRSTEAKGAAKLPRARIGTMLAVEGRQLVLRCTGTDPGLAFDRLAQPLTGGPFTLTFRVQSRASGSGELFWTTDAQTTLPKGRRLEFPVAHDGQWHEVTLSIPERQSLHAFRLDPCAGAGEVRLEALQIADATGQSLLQWP
jgi:arylsulfatase